jgi:hypothetical protein
MIGVGEGVSDDVPSLFIWQLFHIKKYSEQLYGCNDWMRVIHLNLVELREVIPV